MSARANERLAEQVVGAALGAGVKLVFVSPGSRSTPLVACFDRARRAGLVELELVLDERSSAFAAVGAARAGSRAAVLTTSGTAVANLLPGLCEADRDELALVAITADRPALEVTAGANQTVLQMPLLAGPVRAALDLDAASFEASLTGELQACLSALDGPSPGPVHLNVRFSKPLEPTGEAGVPVASQRAQPHSPPPPTARFEGVERGLVVVGALPGRARPAVDRFLRQLPWPALVDLTSGLDRAPSGRFAPGLLRAEAARTRLEPDRVLWIGGRLTEPAVASWLKGREVHQWRAGDAVRDPDRLFTSSHHVNLVADLPNPVGSTPSELGLESLASHAPPLEPQLTEPFVARTVVESTPADEHLFVGNSMPIRDSDRFARSLVANLLTNRGVSGIDGNLATCFGAWRATGRPVRALIGDLTFLHDSGSLALLSESQAPIRLVCLNNSGGGIFHQLPIVEHRELFEPWFGTPHGRDLTAIARGYGLQAEPIQSAAELQARLAEPPDGPELFEIRTDRVANARLHAELDRAYREGLL